LNKKLNGDSSLDRLVHLKDILDAKWLSLQIKLDILAVVLGIKPASRIFLLPTTVAGLAENLIALGVSIEVGSGMVSQPISRNTWSYTHDTVGDINERLLQKFNILYISLDEANAISAKMADEQGDDFCLGLVLGYPRCCIDHTVGSGGVPSNGFYVEQAISLGHYNPLVWPPALQYDAYILHHHPCSINCNESARLARWI